MNSGKRLLFASVIIAVIASLFLLDLRGGKEAGTDVPSLVLYCAAGLKEPVQAVVERYQKDYGILIEVQYGGSGTLLSNIKVAQRGDLFLAADQSYLDLARNDGLVREIIPLAEMRPVVAVAKGNPKGINGVSDLLREDVVLGLANPEAAAVGKSTRELLEAAGVWGQIEAKTRVFKPTVMDLANDVKIGTIDVTVVWDAIVRQYPDLEAVPMADLDGKPELISVGVLAASAHPTAALRFARFLSARDRGLEEFAKSGFDPIDGDPWSERPRLVFFSGGVNRLAIEETLEEFEEREGVELIRSYNGCGILVAQMKAGEIPDAYFACDVSFMNNVPEIFPTSIPISETRMVILTQKDNPRNIQTLADLTEGGLKIAVANPEQSALGKLTVDLLKSEGLLDAVMKNVVVQGPTADLLVNQMQTGSLDAAVVYEANTAYVRDKLEVISIEGPNATAIQPYGVANQSPNKQIMNRLLETLRGEQSRHKFEEVGFDWKAAQEGS